MNVCVIIPSYNESKTIGSLVEKIRSQGLDVLVIDDGSVDRTTVSARASGAEVLGHRENQGKGISLRDGFRYILNYNYQAVITMDADQQHAPGDIPKFIKEAEHPEIDMVVGNRMGTCKNMPFIRWVTNIFTSTIISLICRKVIPDSQCGFRLIKKELLEKLQLSSTNYEIESEIIIEARRKGGRLKFVPIQTIYSRENSQINPIIDTLRFFKFILKTSCPFLK